MDERNQKRAREWVVYGPGYSGMYDTLEEAMAVFARNDHDGAIYRRCESFTVPTAEPEPAPLDPVLVAIRDLYVLVTTEPKAALALDSLSCELRQRWRKITRAGTREYEVDSAIRAYGRDGVR